MWVGSATQELQNLEQRAAQALHGVAAEIARDVQSLTSQTAATMQMTAESSVQATGSLADRTAEAFVKTEGHLNSLYQDIQR